MNIKRAFYLVLVLFFFMNVLGGNSVYGNSYNYLTKIDFSLFPGADGMLGTEDDVEVVEPDHVYDQYASVGVIFSLDDPPEWPPWPYLASGLPYNPTSTAIALRPFNGFAEHESDIRDIVMEFSVPVNYLEITSLDSDEPWTLRAFNDIGEEIATHFQKGLGDQGVGTASVVTDGSYGMISKVVIDVSETDDLLGYGAGPEGFDDLIFGEIDLKVDLPKTGQKSCYDETGNLEDCNGTGQDGEIQAGVEWPSPRFVDNGDGTVTDKLTGLMWLKDARCPLTINYEPPPMDIENYEPPRANGLTYWPQALELISKINSGEVDISECSGYTANYSDWRLPNREEMYSLADFSESYPGIPSDHPFVNVAGWFWTSTSANDNRAWIVDLGSDAISTTAEKLNFSNGWVVWPVRAGQTGAPDANYPANIPKTGQKDCWDAFGNQIDCAGTGQDGEIQAGVTWPYPRFTDNGDGTITDHLTGLMWLKDSNCLATNCSEYDEDGIQGDGLVTWQHALNFAKSLNNGEHPECSGVYNDWRLPNAVELKSLVNFRNQSPWVFGWLNDQGFTNVSTGYYWTSTTRVDDNSFASAISMYHGYMPFRNKTDEYFAWMVRDANAIPNQPPIVEAGENLSINTEALMDAVIIGSATDPDVNEMEYRWVEGEMQLSEWLPVTENGDCPLPLASKNLSIGEHILTLEVRDLLNGNVLSITQDSLTLTVENSSPHIGIQGGAGTYEIGQTVTVVAEISDFDGDLLEYSWKEGTTVLCSGAVQSIEGGEPVPVNDCIVSGLDLGVHILMFVVSDGINEVISEIEVVITDTETPSIAPVSNKAILWPPNHEMIEIQIEANASDNSGWVTLSADVISNEPQDGLGDGDMAPDYTEPVINQDTGTINLSLRAERSAIGDGREYTIEVTATDPSLNSSTSNIIVIVPHDKRKK